MTMKRQETHPERLGSGLLPKDNGGMITSLATMWRINRRETRLKIDHRGDWGGNHERLDDTLG